MQHRRRALRRGTPLVALFALAGCANAIAPPGPPAPTAVTPPRPAHCPSALGPGRWSRAASEGAPSARTSAPSARVGDRVLLWGGTDGRADLTDGALYEPRTDRWSALPPAPASFLERARYVGATPLGERVLLWSALYGTGVVFDASTGRWSTLPAEGAPRSVQSVVGTPAGWFLWGLEGAGGHNSATLLTLDPPAFHQVLAPLEQDARNNGGVTFTGQQVFVWGGTEASAFTQPVRDDGYRYDPLTDQWSSVERANAPSGRWAPEVFWTGSEALVWGGSASSGQRWDGALYDPLDDRWRSIPSAESALAVSSTRASVEVRAAWTGCELFVLITGPETAPRAALLDPTTLQWRPAAPFPDAAGPAGASVLYTGSSVLVWGGTRGTRPSSAPTNDGWLWTPDR